MDADTGNQGLGPGKKNVSPRGIIGVTIYTISAIVVPLIFLYIYLPTACSSADTPRTPNPPANPINSSAANLSVTGVFPAAGSFNGNTSVLIKGNGFKKQATVIFGGIPVAVTEPISDAGDSLVINTPPNQSGIIDLVVKNQDGAAAVLPAAFTYNCPQPPDQTLFIFVISAGALGGSLHTLRSLYWYVGNRELVWSWVLMYVLLPFSGAAMATIFFLIIRGGLLQKSQTEGEFYWFIIGFSVLVGMFSQQATLKLRDVANALLTKPGEGRDTVPQTSETVDSAGKNKSKIQPTLKIEPLKGSIKGGEEVKISGSGLNSVKSLKIGDKSITEFKFDPATSTISFKTPQQEQIGEVEVILEAEDGNPFKLKYTYQD